MSVLTPSDQALRVASCRGLFTLDGLCAEIDLLPEDLTGRAAVWRALAAVSDEHIRDGAYCWQIAPDARRAALEQFDRLGELQEFVAGLEPNTLPDPLGTALAELLGGARISLDDPGAQAPREDLRAAIARAATVLDAAQFAKEVPALKNHQFHLRISDRAPYQHLTLGSLMRVVGAHIKELQTRQDIQIVIPKDHFGYTPQLRQISRFARGKCAEKPLLLTGIGGVGKSALLSRLMLGWQRSQPEMIQIALDFDRRQLSQGEPVEIVLEMLRQIIAFLSVKNVDGNATLLEGLRTLGANVALHKTRATSGQADNTTQQSLIRRVLALLLEPWAEPLVATRMVVVLDTFEAIDRMAVFYRRMQHAAEPYHGNEVVSQIMGLMTTIQQVYLPNMRVIVCGREEPLAEAELDEWFGPRVRLSGLSSISGAKLLQAEAAQRSPQTAQAFRDTDKARQVSRLLGGHPLALISFVKYIENNPADFDNLIAEIDAEGGFAAEFAQVFLYTRILQRITDPQIRPLAHPGLMLRYLDRDIIQNVLAGPCLGRGPDDADPLSVAEADDLLAKLRNQYWLVEPVEGHPDMVRHIADLRRLMLPGLLAGPADSDTGADRSAKLDMQQRALALCRVAADYFTARGHGTDALDALYYGAFDSEPPEDFPVDLAEDLDRHLREDVRTLPVKWRALIQHLLGRDLTDRELTALPEGRRSEAADRMVSDMRQTGVRMFTGKRGKLKKAVNPALSPDVSTPQTKTPIQTPPDFEMAWSDADPNISDRAAPYLQAAVKMLQLNDTHTVWQTVEQDLQQQPLGNPIYIALLLRMTDHAPWTPQFWPLDVYGMSQESPLNQLLMSAAFVEQMDFDSAKDHLHSYLHGFEDRTPIAANRLAAETLLNAVSGTQPKPPDTITLHMAGLSLATGNDAHRATLSAPYRQLLGEAWGQFEREGASLSRLERLYRDENTMTLAPAQFTDLSDPEKQHFLTMLRGLTPELYKPTTALLAELDPTLGQSVVQQTIETLALWPEDLRFEGRLGYGAADASAVVETADRCGALRHLLENLLPHADFAERLIAIHDRITRIFFPEVEVSPNRPPIGVDDVL